MLCIECDVTQWQDCVGAVKKAADHFGAVHGLVNNAGVGMQHIGNVLVGRRKRFFEVDADTWRKAIDANFNGPFMMARAIAPKLDRARLGADRQHRDKLFHNDDGRFLALRSVEGCARSGHRHLVEGSRRNAASRSMRSSPADPPIRA